MPNGLLRWTGVSGRPGTVFARSEPAKPISEATVPYGDVPTREPRSLGHQRLNEKTDRPNRLSRLVNTHSETVVATTGAQAHGINRCLEGPASSPALKEAIGSGTDRVLCGQLRNALTGHGPVGAGSMGAASYPSPCFRHDHRATLERRRRRILSGAMARLGEAGRLTVRPAGFAGIEPWGSAAAVSGRGGGGVQPVVKRTKPGVGRPAGGATRLRQVNADGAITSRRPPGLAAGAGRGPAGVCGKAGF